MDQKAQVEEDLAKRSSGQDALTHAIKAAELYMKAATTASSKSDAAQLRRRCQDLITFAEKLKSRLSKGMSTEALSTLPSHTLQTDILTESSNLHGNMFPPWSVTSSVLGNGLSLSGHQDFIDDANYTLSAAQIDNFAAWVKPAELFDLDDSKNKEAFEAAAMAMSSTSDLVQDITTDCSVVASLSAAFHVLTGNNAVLASIFHPFDHEKGRPRFSSSGKYVMKLNFNGCARQVVIDDRLPSSRTDRALFVVDRHNPYLLWPALLEKAYLKVRGGYDFPGSNSGTDLWVLIGWIPEQLLLQKEDIDIDDIWRRIESGYHSQNVVITLGTGNISTEEQAVMGLIGEHDYAVEDIDSSRGSRRLLVKNPWRDSPSMRTTGRTQSTSLHLAEFSSSQPLKEDRAQLSTSGSRQWIAIEDVAQHFESMYLNWNPSLFSQRQDKHFSWEIPSPIYSTSLSKNPQYVVISPSRGSIWILVSRHFVDAELDIARNRRDSMAAVARQLGFMSILVLENEGQKVQMSGQETYRGPYVDSPQTLTRLEVRAGKPYTIVLDQQELPLSRYTFTMSLFSHSPLKVTEALDMMSQTIERHGSWTRRTAGGNSSCSTYFQNPQYSLFIRQATPVSLLLSSDASDIHVHIDVVWAQDRVRSVRQKDLVASSGEYRRGCAMAEIEILQPGTYILVCSTFEVGQTADFVLRIASMASIDVTSVAADVAGRLVGRIPQLRLLEGEEKNRLAIGASRLTSASVSIRSTNLLQHRSKTRLPLSLMVRVSVVHGWGSQQVEIVESGNEYKDPSMIVRTPQFDIDPERVRSQGLWVVLESIGSHEATLAIEGDILSDSPVQIGSWESI